MGDGPYWRPTTEWENPIWGWIVTNYADYGIQLFLFDGTFYGEVRIGGSNGVLDSPKWSPFKPPENYDPKMTARLDALIKRLQVPAYIKGFWAMLTSAIDSLPPAPGAYAQFLGSIVGKPFALVNMGWSLELDGPPLVNQSTTAAVAEPERVLIHPDPQDDDQSYVLQVKFGDKEREYDGLIGYFDGMEKPDDQTGEDLKYDCVKTFFSPVDDSGKPIFDNLKAISSDNYPKFRPYWEPPLDEQKDRDVTPEQYADGRNQHLQVFGAILDPFTAVHAYSSFLPSRDLALQPWTWQDALGNILAFIHAGPVTVVADVGAYEDSQRLTIQKAKQRPPRDLGLMPLQSGDWNWLQPYDDHEGPLYNAFGIDSKGNVMKPGFEKGPYTALEGFLQLRRPLMAEKPDNA